MCHIYTHTLEYEHINTRIYILIAEWGIDNRCRNLSEREYMKNGNMAAELMQSVEKKKYKI